MKKQPPYTTLLMKALVHRTWIWLLLEAFLVYITVALAQKSPTLIMSYLWLSWPIFGFFHCMLPPQRALVVLPLSWKQIVTVIFTYCALIAPLVLMAAACGAALTFMLFTGSASKSTALLFIITPILAAEAWLAAVMQSPNRLMKYATLAGLAILLGCLFIPNKGPAVIFVLLVDIVILITALGYMFKLRTTLNTEKEYEYAEYEEWEAPPRTSLQRFYVSHALETVRTAFYIIIAATFVGASVYLTLCFIGKAVHFLGMMPIMVYIVVLCSFSYKNIPFRVLRSLPMKPTAILFWKLNQIFLIILICLIPPVFYGVHAESILSRFSIALLFFAFPFSLYIMALTCNNMPMVLTVKSTLLVLLGIIMLVVLVLLLAIYKELVLSPYCLMTAALVMLLWATYKFFHSIAYNSTIYKHNKVKAWYE
jgi:hypothetical protein